MSLAYLDKQQINYSPALLARILEKISCPTEEDRRFHTQRPIGENSQVSLESYIVSGIKYTYKVFNARDSRASLEEKLTNPDIETLTIFNCYGPETERGTEIRIRRVRNSDSIIVRYKSKHKSSTKKFNTRGSNSDNEIENYIRRLMNKLD